MDETIHKKELTICNKKGLHARASAAFVKCAGAFDADVKVTSNGETVGGTSIMGLMMLAACQGTKIKVAATGKQASEAVAALAELVEAGFYEDE